MLGKIIRSKNLDQKITASAFYYRLLVLNSDNQFETLLLTENELVRIRGRVKKNPEDEIQPSWFDRLVSFLGSFPIMTIL